MWLTVLLNMSVSAHTQGPQFYESRKMHDPQVRYGTHGSPNKSICYHVRLSRMIFNGTFIILEQFNPSPLSHVQFLLRKQILQTLMIRKNPIGHSI